MVIYSPRCSGDTIICFTMNDVTNGTSTAAPKIMAPPKISAPTLIFANPFLYIP